MAEERRWTVFRLRNRSARQLHAHVNTDRRVVDDDLPEQALQAEREKREQAEAELHMIRFRTVTRLCAERDQANTRAEKAEAKLEEVKTAWHRSDEEKNAAHVKVMAAATEKRQELEAQLATLQAEVDSSIRRIRTWFSDEATHWEGPSQQTLLSMVESCDELLDSLHKPDQQGER